MKISENFCSEEFISRDLHNSIDQRGLDPRWYIDKDLVKFCEWLKTECNGVDVTINNWKWGGLYQFSGLRGPNDIGALLSQHKFKNAIDVKVKGFTPSQIRQIILDNFIYINTEFGITTIEKIKDTPTWVHIDKRWTGLNYLLEVNG